MPHPEPQFWRRVRPYGPALNATLVWQGFGTPHPIVCEPQVMWTPPPPWHSRETEKDEKGDLEGEYRLYFRAGGWFTTPQVIGVVFSSDPLREGWSYRSKYWETGARDPFMPISGAGYGGTSYDEIQVQPWIFYQTGRQRRRQNTPDMPTIADRDGGVWWLYAGIHAGPEGSLVLLSEEAVEL